MHFSNIFLLTTNSNRFSNNNYSKGFTISGVNRLWYKLEVKSTPENKPLPPCWGYSFTAVPLFTRETLTKLFTTEAFKSSMRRLIDLHKSNQFFPPKKRNSLTSYLPDQETKEWLDLTKVDEELVDYLNAMWDSAKDKTLEPMSLGLHPGFEETTHPALYKTPLELVRARYIMLRGFNDMIAAALPLTELPCAQVWQNSRDPPPLAGWNLSYALPRVRGIIFYHIKRKYLSLCCKAMGSSPSRGPLTISLNRFLSLPLPLFLSPPKLKNYVIL